MRLTSVFMLSAALLVSSAAVAKDSKLAVNESASAGTGYQAASEAPETAEKKICKQIERTGTRKTERVCLTKQDWKKVDEQR